jgi:hypothetical protein
MGASTAATEARPSTGSPASQSGPSTGEDFPELVQELRTYLGAPMPGAISGLSEQEVARDFSNAASIISLLAIGIAQSARRTLAIVG